MNMGGLHPFRQLFPPHTPLITTCYCLLTYFLTLKSKDLSKSEEAEVSTQIPFGCDESCSCSEMQETCFAMPDWLQVALPFFLSTYRNL